MKLTLSNRSFKTKLDAEHFVESRVLRQVKTTEYQINIKDLDKLKDRVEVLDKTVTNFIRLPDDEPLKAHAKIIRVDGLYRVGLPA